MARFARIDSQIRANRLILANCFRVPEPNPFFANRALWGLKIANRRFEAIRVNRSRVLKMGVFLRIDSRESICANRPDSRCESPGHLSRGFQIKTALGTHQTPVETPSDKMRDFRATKFKLASEQRFSLR